MDYTKDHKSKVNSLLMERWGFKAPKNKEISHLCAMLVTEKATGKIGHPINHTLLEGGSVTHYDVEFDDVIVEGMPVRTLDVEVQKEHMHGRREDYAHDEDKPRTQYAEVVYEEEEGDPEPKLAGDVERVGKKLGQVSGLEGILATINNRSEFEQVLVQFINLTAKEKLKPEDVKVGVKNVYQYIQKL